MPVHLEWVTTPSDQDQIDLQKLLKDAPSDWAFTHSLDDLIAHVKDENRQIAAGRFNDRLIAIALITPTDRDDSYDISHVLVRNVTRQRGVAKQMLVRLTQWADQEGFSLVVQDEEHQYRTLLEFGFLYERPTWKRK